eukprot:5550788-Prymnesium_polylepis.1
MPKSTMTETACALNGCRMTEALDARSPLPYKARVTQPPKRGNTHAGGFAGHVDTTMTGRSDNCQRESLLTLMLTHDSVLVRVSAVSVKLRGHGAL